MAQYVGSYSNSRSSLSCDAFEDGPTLGHGSTMSDFFFMLTKLMIILSASLFVLLLPLGDPESKCGADYIQKDTDFIRDPVLLKYLCDLHAFLKDASLRTESVVRDSVKTVTSATVNALYNAFYDIKILFYQLLEKLDGADLCQSCRNSACTKKVERELKPASIVEKAGICRCTNCKCGISYHRDTNK